MDERFRPSGFRLLLTETNQKVSRAQGSRPHKSHLSNMRGFYNLCVVVKRISPFMGTPFIQAIGQI